MTVAPYNSCQMIAYSYAFVLHFMDTHFTLIKVLSVRKVLLECANKSLKCMMCVIECHINSVENALQALVRQLNRFV